MFLEGKKEKRALVDRPTVLITLHLAMFDISKAFDQPSAYVAANLNVSMIVEAAFNFHAKHQALCAVRERWVDPVFCNMRQNLLNSGHRLHLVGISVWCFTLAEGMLKTGAHIAEGFDFCGPLNPEGVALNIRPALLKKLARFCGHKMLQKSQVGMCTH